MLKLWSTFFIGCFIFLGNPSFAQENVPKHIDRKYRKDAARLALRLEAQYEDFRYLSTEIPPQNIKMIFSSLKNIYMHDATAKTLADCNIHTFPDPAIERLVVIFEEGKIWNDASLASMNSTEYQTFNQVLLKYDLVIEKHFQWNGEQDAVTIRSRKPLNMAAIADQLTNIEGVESIDMGIPKTKGNDIQLTRKDNGWEVEFVLLFGNHLMGDGQSHIWKYFAGDDGTVQFVEESGDPVPEWMRCKIKSPEMFVNRL